MADLAIETPRAFKPLLGDARYKGAWGGGDGVSKIRDSARNEDCTIRLPMVCNFNPETTVLCHPNTHRAGKGKSLKAEDALVRSAARIAMPCWMETSSGRSI